MRDWPQGRVTTWDGFTEWIVRLTKGGTAWHGVFFRGQASSEWSLLPSITRILGANNTTADDAVKIEQLMMKEFRYEAYRYFPASILPKPKQQGAWLMLMQHHFAPTRLLDWTFSPYVAAYFAVSDCLGQDGAIWCFSVDRLTDSMKELGRARTDEAQDLVLDPQQPLGVHTIGFDKKSDRMVLQQGAFTICNQLMADFAETIPSVLVEAFDESVIPDSCLKLSIASDAKAEFLANLRFANITGRAIFEGADGVGRSVRELAVGWPAYKRAADGARFGLESSSSS